jgi:hypothetical protein
VAQVVKCLLGKYKALSSKPQSHQNKTKNKSGRERSLVKKDSNEGVDSDSKSNLTS